MFWAKKKKRRPALAIDADRPTLEITMPDGSTTRWQYDVVVLKLKIQQIQEGSGRRVPSQEDLELFRDCLLALGMPACNVDIALRLWSLVTVQFQQVAISISNQVRQCQ